MNENERYRVKERYRENEKERERDKMMSILECDHITVHKNVEIMSGMIGRQVVTKLQSYTKQGLRKHKVQNVYICYRRRRKK